MKLAITDFFFLYGSGNERLDYSPFRAYQAGQRSAPASDSVP